MNEFKIHTGYLYGSTALASPFRAPQTHTDIDVGQTSAGHLNSSNRFLQRFLVHLGGLKLFQSTSCCRFREVEAALMLQHTSGFIHIPVRSVTLFSSFVLRLHVNKKHDHEKKRKKKEIGCIPHSSIFLCNRGNGPTFSMRTGGLARQLTSLQQDPKTFDVKSAPSPFYLSLKRTGET